MNPFLLDSNVVSELWKPHPSEKVVSWINSAEWLIPVVVIAEIQEGAELAPTTARRTQINQRLDDFLRDSSGLIMDWDAETARTWARLRHSREVKIQPQSLWDSLIDAMAIRYGMPIASRNHMDFRHSEVFDPWTGTSHQSKGLA
jgi:predicted nucleic acid-binding protein